MRLAAVLALAAAAGAARGACRGGIDVLAEASAGRLSQKGRQELRLDFALSSTARVWAEASGLDGLQGGNGDADPEVFLDNAYLGPLSGAYGDFWRSPRAVDLDAGAHALVLRRAEGEGAGPLTWGSVRVLDDARCPPCSGLVERHEWPQRLHGRDLVLSVVHGTPVPSGSLVRIREGEEWRARIRIPARPDGSALPMEAGLDNRFVQGLCFFLFLDNPGTAPDDAKGYVPESWEPLALSLCGGALHLTFARLPAWNYPWKKSSAEFEVEVQDLEVTLAPASSHHP